MTILYNRYTQEGLDFAPDTVADALGTGFWVATLGETTPGAPPEPPRIPPYAGGGAAGEPTTQPILSYPPATELVEDGDWIRILDVSSGQEVRCTRTQFLAALGIAWDNVSGKPANFPVDWQALPEAISSTVSSTGGAGPSDTVPLMRHQSADAQYGWGALWKTYGAINFYSRWNGVDYTFISLPARTSIGGGPVVGSEFHLGAEHTPVNGANPATGGMHSIAWGPQKRLWRWLSPDSFDLAALRVTLRGPSGEQTNVRMIQPASSYFGWYAADSYSATAIPAWAVQHVALEVNGLQAVGAVAGASPKIEARGADENIDAVVKPKGTGAFAVEAATGAPAKFTAAGPDADHNAELFAKGAGTVAVGTGANKLTFFGGAGVFRPVVTEATVPALLAALTALNLIDNQTV
ncbi:hypothetical protein VZ95_11235 [Elstera litoralis]|uniref:Uncharacterized protein n=1 Tax=Elstera litoralis TaxID=552518 RepID=A0A0F3IS67_9PROT|nr:hypothetical protein [Elstera litoralis]KJV09482.1 hypothetical protein VZ95_11235 [Elstera litoralis]